MAPNFLKGLGKAIGPLVASRINKEDFLAQLKETWTPMVSRDTDIDTEVTSAMERVKKSGLERLFKTVDTTEEDIRRVLLEIQSGKKG